MRIVVMGTGGIGGYFGARLAQGGSEVTFIARGAHLQAIRENGLRVASALGDLHLSNPKVSENPAEAGPADLVLLGVKLWDTEAAARALKPLTDAGAAIVSFQNGVQKDDVLRGILGESAVLGGAAYIAATIEAPGLIRHTGTMARLLFGEYDGRPSRRTEAFLEACRAGSIDASVSLEIQRSLWEKFVFLVGLSGTTTAIRQTIGPILANPQSRALLLDAMREVVEVGRAQGVGLDPDFAEQRLAFCDGLPPDMTSSMHKDLEKGNRLEVPWLSGDVVRRGQGTGIPTPVNRALADILALHAGGGQG